MGISPSAVTPILAFGTGAINSGTVGGGGGGGAGVTTFADFAVTKLLDAFSVPLLQAAATGTHIQQVKIEVFEIGSPTPFATYSLLDALITSDTIGSSVSQITENVSFTYTKIATSITLGGVTFDACFDRVNNTSC